MKYESYGVIVIKELLPLFPNAQLQQEYVRNKAPSKFSEWDQM